MSKKQVFVVYWGLKRRTNKDFKPPIKYPRCYIYGNKIQKIKGIGGRGSAVLSLHIVLLEGSP